METLIPQLRTELYCPVFPMQTEEIGNDIRHRPEQPRVSLSHPTLVNPILSRGLKSS